MTLEKLQAEMVTAMKNGDKPRKTAISGYIAAIKKVAIDKGCRDNIDEQMVNDVLTKLKKQAKESVDACPASRTDLLKQYKYEYSVITEFAPTFIDDPILIKANLESLIEECGFTLDKKSRGLIMKQLSANNWKAHFDMAVVSKVLGEMLA